MMRLRWRVIARALRRDVERRHGTDEALRVLLEQRAAVGERGELIPIARIQTLAIRAERRRRALRRVFGLKRAGTAAG
jgi:hypothetical protein